MESCEGDDGDGNIVNDGDPIDTSTVGPATLTVRGTDRHNRVTAVVRNYTVAESDVFPPDVTVNVPADGVPTYVLKQVVNADYDCDDPNLVSCVGTVPDGSPINTATITPGNTTRSFTVTGTDSFGRTTVVEHPYRVRYADGTPCGSGNSHRFTTPQGVRRVGLAEDIIVRIPLCTANGTPVGPADLGAPFIPIPVEIATGQPARGGCDPILDLIPLCTPLINRPYDSFKYGAGGGHWRFPHSSIGLSLGKHTFRVSLPDGTFMDYTLNVKP